MSDPKSELDEEAPQKGPTDSSGPRTADEADSAAPSVPAPSYRPPMPTPRGGMSGPPRPSSGPPPPPSTSQRPKSPVPTPSGPPRPQSGVPPRPRSGPPADPPKEADVSDRETPMEENIQVSRPPSPPPPGRSPPPEQRSSQAAPGDASSPPAGSGDDNGSRASSEASGGGNGHEGDGDAQDQGGAQDQEAAQDSGDAQQPEGPPNGGSPQEATAQQETAAQQVAAGQQDAAEQEAKEGASSEDAEGPSSEEDDDIPPPIKAMRRVAIGQPPPDIEANETTLEELEDDFYFGPAELSDEDLVERTSEQPPEVATDLTDEIASAPDTEDSEEVETIETVEQVEPVAPKPPSAAPKPPPPKRSQKPSLPKAKTRRKPWWETLFGDDFSRAHRPPTPAQLKREVDFVCKKLGLKKGAVVLDLGCGQGEQAVELCQRGISVVGYDLSVFQLAMAGDRAQAAKQKINFLQGDMREMAFETMFDAVLCWGTTFGYFEEEKNVDVARRMYKALKPGGSLLMDIMNRDFAAQEAPTNIWFEGDGCVCMDDVELDWITSRLKVKRSIILDDGRSKELYYSIRLYGLTEIGKLLHDVGFRVRAVSGDVSTPGAYFGPASPRIIIAAQRP